MIVLGRMVIVMPDTIGGRIRQARKTAGLTQRELSERAFISESYLTLIELDKRNPSTDVVSKLAEILNISADHLLFGDIPKNEQTLFSEWKQLMNGRSADEIEGAQKLVRCFFESLDKTKNSE